MQGACYELDEEFKKKDVAAEEETEAHNHTYIARLWAATRAPCTTTAAEELPRTLVCTRTTLIPAAPFDEGSEGVNPTSAQPAQLSDGSVSDTETV